MGEAYRPGMPVPPGLERCVRPEHVPQLSFIAPEKRQPLSQHVLNLWNQAINHPKESQEFAKVSHNLMLLTQQVQKQRQMARDRAAQASGQSQTQSQGQNPGQASQPQPDSAASQGTQPQNAPQQPQPGAQAPPAVAQNPATSTASPAQPGQGTNRSNEASAQRPQGLNWEKFKGEVDEAIKNFQPPLEISKQSPEKVKEYVSTWTNKARQMVMHMEAANMEHMKLQKTVADRQRTTGMALNEEDKQKLRTATERIKNKQQTCASFLSGFIKQSKANLQAQAGAGTGGGPSGAAAANSSQGQNQNALSQAQIKKEPTESTNVTSQASPTTQTPTQPTAPSQKPAPNQLPASSAPPVKPEPQRALPTQASTSQQPQQAASAPQALSHQAALDRARNHPQATASAQTPTSSQSAPQQHHQGHPGMGRSDSHSQSNSSRNLVTKNLNLNPLQPVTMPPARPTLSGGPGGQAGVMSQPGLQKHPGYVLEGEGERVLSEKKLEELVRQVTGSAGGEGSDTLDPDVKETLLDLADEFVDNVISSACRVAKLRSSSTLELRDLQLILERNYNIRVPGYASDELRTVKKIQPSQAWAQKMSAVQAAKVTGGKGDL